MPIRLFTLPIILSSTLFMSACSAPVSETVGGPQKNESAQENDNVHASDQASNGNSSTGGDVNTDDSSNTNPGNTDTNVTISLSEITFPPAYHVVTQRALTLRFHDKGRMWLDVGSVLGSQDIVNESISGDQFTIAALPDNLTELHVTIWTFIEGEWEFKRFNWAVAFDSGMGAGDDAMASLTGQKIWNTTCSNSSCHSLGAKQGVFEEEKLRAKELFTSTELSEYIAKYMPLTDIDACDAECADKVSDYIVTFQGLPVKNNDTANGSPRNPVIVEQCNTATSIGYQNVRLLTQQQYQNSIEDLLRVDFDVTKQLPIDIDAGSFTNNNQLNVLDSAYISYMNVAETIATWSADQNFSNILQCNSVNASCAQSFVNDVAWKIIRRPLTNNEQQQYLSLAQGDATNGDIKESITLALTALLSSPQFLYRHEIGEPVSGLGSGVFELTPFELASYISYGFAGTTPDTTLLNAAKNNQLATDQQIEAQISRLLDSATSETLMEDLVHKWLDTEHILIQQKDNSVFQNFPQVAPHMMTELSKMFSHVMLDENEKYESLYNANYTFLNATLAQHYGIDGVSGDQFKKVYNNERGGLLLSGAFLSRWSHTDETNAVTRAVHIRRDMLCQDIPNPPTGVSLSLKDKEGELADFLEDPATTQRMRFHETTEFGSCSACHSEIINPLGFGLEDYDFVGIKRNQDSNGNVINAQGALWSPFAQLQFYDDPNRIQKFSEFTGGKELAEVLAVDPDVSAMAKSCLVKQMYSFVSGIDSRSLIGSERDEVIDLSEQEKNSYSCDVMDLVDTLTTQSPRRMLEKMGSLDSVRYRKAWSR